MFLKVVIEMFFLEDVMREKMVFFGERVFLEDV